MLTVSRIIANVEQQSLEDAKLECALLCDYFTELKNGCYDLIGVGGNVFIAPFPRALCYAYVRVLVPYRELSEDLEHKLQAVLLTDEGPAISTKTVRVKPVRDNNLREGAPQPVSYMFNFNDAVINYPGHYTLRILWDDVGIGETHFEMLAPVGGSGD